MEGGDEGGEGTADDADSAEGCTIKEDPSEEAGSDEGTGEENGHGWNATRGEGEDGREEDGEWEDEAPRDLVKGRVKVFEGGGRQ